MSSFVKQYDNYSCGPIAIFNAFTALGHRPRNYREIRQSCNPHPEYGTLYINFNTVLYRNLPSNVECEYVIHPNYRLVSDHIKNGGVVIICEHWEHSKREAGEHYYTVVKFEDNKYLVANKDHAKEWITSRQLRTSLIQHRVDELPTNCQQPTAEDDLIYPTAWLLKIRGAKKRQRGTHSTEHRKRAKTCFS